MRKTPCTVSGTQKFHKWKFPFPSLGAGLYMGSIGQGAGRREIKYKGRREEGRRGKQRRQSSRGRATRVRGKKGAGAMDRPRTKSPDFISTASFVLKEGRQDKGTVTSSIPHSLAHSCQHKKDGCDGVSAPQYK